MDYEDCNRLRLEAYAECARLENMLEQVMTERDRLKADNRLLNDRLRKRKVVKTDRAVCKIDSLKQVNGKMKKQLDHAIQELSRKGPLSQEQWNEYFSRISNVEE